MKEGFYLSPDGLHIVQILGGDILGNNDDMELSVIGDFPADYLCCVFNSDAEIIFSSWEYLG